MSKRTLRVLSELQLSTGSHRSKSLPHFRIKDSSDSYLGGKRLKLMNQGNSTHDQPLTRFYPLGLWPCFARKY